MTKQSIVVIVCALLLGTLGCEPPPSTSADSVSLNQQVSRARKALASSCGALQPGEELQRGHYVLSCDSNVVLYHQEDGNVVVYDQTTQPSIPLWSTGTSGQTSTLAMQHDGNLVLYGPNGYLWASHTQSPGASLAIQNDCNVVLYNGAAVWDIQRQCLPRREGLPVIEVDVETQDLGDGWWPDQVDLPTDWSGEDFTLEAPPAGTQITRNGTRYVVTNFGSYYAVTTSAPDWGMFAKGAAAATIKNLFVAFAKTPDPRVLGLEILGTGVAGLLLSGHSSTVWLPADTVAVPGAPGSGWAYNRATGNYVRTGISSSMLNRMR